MEILGFCSLALVIAVLFLGLRIGCFYLALLLVVGIAQWQVETHILLAIAVGLALIVPTSSSSKDKS